MESINNFMKNNKLRLKDEGIKSKFICDSCDLIVDRATVTRCGCSFCTNCIEPYLTGENVDCPKCKSVINVEKDVGPSFELDFKISKLMMTCPNVFCDQKLSVSEMSDHIDVCFNTACKCVLHGFGCESVFKANTDIKLHLNDELDKHFELVIKKLESSNNEKSENINHLEKKIDEMGTEILEINRKFEDQIQRTNLIISENLELKSKFGNQEKIFETKHKEYLKNFRNLKTEMNLKKTENLELKKKFDEKLKDINLNKGENINLIKKVEDDKEVGVLFTFDEGKNRID